MQDVLEPQAKTKARLEPKRGQKRENTQPLLELEEKGTSTVQGGSSSSADVPSCFLNSSGVSMNECWVPKRFAIRTLRPVCAFEVPSTQSQRHGGQLTLHGCFVLPECACQEHHDALGVTVRDGILWREGTFASKHFPPKKKNQNSKQQKT